LKWAGVIYLLYLGVQHCLAYYKNEPAKPVSASYSFKRGFWVALTNPKTIIFFSAFLPQFVSPQSAYLPQIAVLSCVFLLLAVVLDCLYVVLTSTLKNKLHSPAAKRRQHGFSGLVYFIASGLLASTNQSP